MSIWDGNKPTWTTWQKNQKIFEQQNYTKEQENKRQCQHETEISRLEQLGKKKQKLFEQQISRAKLFDSAKEQELSHLQQEPNHAQLVHSTITNLKKHNQNTFILSNHHLLLEEAVKFLNAKNPKGHKWSNFEKNPIKSLLLWYANAGCFAFDEYKEYAIAFNGQQIDCKAHEKEISNETLSDQELGNLIKKFSMNHSYTNGNLYACAACGIRQLEQLHPKIEYVSIQLNNALLKSLQYTDDQKNGFCNEQQLHGLQVPCNDQGHFMTLHAWKVKSVYEARSGIFYHLHPELIDIDEAGIESVHLCPTCFSKLEGGKKPQLSIAAGIDFGYYRWLKDLEMPNLHESIILSLNEVVHVTIKISSNQCGHVNFGLN